jgi:hypothetical protein
MNNLFLNAWFSHISPRVYLAYFVENRQWLSLFYLFVLPPIMGLSAYAMKKWSYVVFVAGSTWMLFHNFQAIREGSVPLSYILLIYVGNIGFVTYFLLPRVHAPYLNPKMRWWESKPRYLVDWPCRVSISAESATLSCRIQDFSEGGVFLLSQDTIAMNQTLEIRLTPSMDEIIALKAKLVFSRPVQNSLGYGLQFIDLDKDSTKRLSSLARDLKRRGTAIRQGRDSTWLAFKFWAKRLITTGEGLLPEVEIAKVQARASSSSSQTSENYSSNSAKAS